jgi:hypothetical protein
LKTYLSSPPNPVSIAPGETFYLYITYEPRAVASFLILERTGDMQLEKVQRPVYYISEILHEAKEHYPQIQKLLYAVLLTTRKLKQYFYAHQVVVHTGYLLGMILTNQEYTGRIASWSIELANYGIMFTPRLLIKAHALDEFVNEGANEAATTESAEDLMGVP